MRKVPEQLSAIADWLSRKKVRLAGGNENSRIDSVKSHSLILSLLLAERSFHIRPFPEPQGGWYSFEVDGDCGESVPVKIKVSSFSRADNLNCKLGIFHALTGVRPDFTDEITWDRYFHLLKTNLDVHCEKDFHFLVVNRLDSSEVFCNSLKGLSVIQPNGSNVPFQCRWADNRTPGSRTNEEATQYILESLGESARLRARMLKGYEEHFGEEKG